MPYAQKRGTEIRRFHTSFRAGADSVYFLERMFSVAFLRFKCHLTVAAYK